MSRANHRRAAAALLLGTVLAASCGSGTAEPKPATPLQSAPEPAVSQPSVPNLPGTVIPLSGAPEGVAVVTEGGT
ncbi:MAG: hypothetical protein M3137_05645, partial [Actinomycetota bacterium]|nr:hypothetical protein [Actinomycetota bacterium]